jgi:phage-related protein
MKDIIFPISYKTDTKGIKDSEDGLKGLQSIAGNIGKSVAGAFAGAAGAVGTFAGFSIAAAADSEAIGKGLANAVEGSQAFGNTASDIKKATSALDEHSNKLGDMTGIDDELINQIKTHWLEVPAIAGMGIAGINKAAEVAANVAAGTGKDIESVSNALSKAMENPATAMTKLQKAGVFLTDSQKAVYDQMVANGDEMGANGYLLDQLGEKYKGAAEASANPFKILQKTFDDLKEAIGGALTPVLKDVVPMFRDFVKGLVSSPEFAAFIKTLGDTFGQLMVTLQPLLPILMGLVMAILPPLMNLIGALAPIIGQLIMAFVPLIEGVLPILVSLIDSLLPIFMELVEKLIVPLIPIVLTLVEAFMPLINAVLPIVSSLLEALMPLLLIVAQILSGVLVAAIGALAFAFELITPVIQAFGQFWGEVFTKLGPILTGVINFLIGAFEGFLNWMIDGLNALLVPLNAVLDGVKAASGGAISLHINPLPKISLPKLADGGIVMPRPGGTQAIIGEAGQPEAVIPLDRLSSMMGKSGATYNLTINAGMGADGASIGEQIVTFIKSYERTNGRVFASA